jgi:hypothetical protein
VARLSLLWHGRLVLLSLCGLLLIIVFLDLLRAVNRRFKAAGAHTRHKRR